MPPTGADDADFRLRSLNGEKVAFAMEGLGYRFGDFHFEGNDTIWLSVAHHRIAAVDNPNARIYFKRVR